MGMSTSLGGSSAGGKSMGGPNTSGPGGYGNDYNGNPNQGGMPTQFAVGGPGMGVGMDYRNLGGNPDMGGGQLPNGLTPSGPQTEAFIGQPTPGLPSTGMGGGKGIGGVIGGMLPRLIAGADPRGAELVGGAYGRPIFGSGTQPQPGTPPEATTAELTPQDTYNQYANNVFGTPNASYTPAQQQAITAQTNFFGGGQQQPMTQGTGQLPPGFGNLSPIDRSQIGGAQIGMTTPANRFAPPNAPGVRTTSARVAKPITRTRVRPR